MDWDNNVQDYLASVDKRNYPEEIRPKYCNNCHKEIFFHHHAHYSRMVYLLYSQHEIIIHRFICPGCRHTKSYLPSFVGPGRQAAWEIHEEVLSQNNNGVPLDKAGEEIPPPAGPFSSKTTARWKKYWDVFLYNKETLIWQWLLKHTPHLAIPVGKQKAKTALGWLFKIWPRETAENAGLKGIGLLQWLYSLFNKPYPVAVAGGE
jgi:hypothetical protein